MTNVTAVLPETEWDRDEVLWKDFPDSTDTTKLSMFGTTDWERNYRLFGEALVSKAKSAKMNAESLEKILGLIRQSAENMAYLPVAAYETSLKKGSPVWVILVKWELVSYKGKGGLGHIRKFAFEEKTLKKVGFVTCN